MRAILLTICLVPWATADAAELYVSTTGADVGDCTDPSAPCASIQYAVDQAATTGDAIHVAAGSYVENVRIRGKSVDIHGEAEATTTIDGGGLARVVDIDAGASAAVVAISNLTLRNGSGGLNNLNASVTLTHVTIADNSLSAGGGGGIYTEGGSLDVIDSTIRDNLASLAGGLLVRSPTLLLRTSVRGNVVSSDGGGMISFGILHIDYSTISGNTCSATGGGICAVGGKLSMEGSLVEGNTASAGGGIFLSGIPAPLTNSTFTGNRADRGGAVLVTGGGELKTANCTVYANEGTSNSGGLGLESSGSMRISNTILAANSAPMGPDCFGALISGRHNIIQSTAGCMVGGDTTGNQTGIDPDLGALSDNGGPTLTFMPRSGSPAIDGGDPLGCFDPLGTPIATDQRREPRPSGCGGDTSCDVGATELCVGEAGPDVYEHTLPTGIVDDTHRIGRASGMLFDHVPPAAPELYYKVGMGVPDVIRIVKTATGITISF